MARIKLAVAGKVCCRNDKVFITEADGKKSVLPLKVDCLESPCMADLRKMRGYKEAHRKGMKLYKDRWWRHKWQRMYDACHGRYRSKKFRVNLLFWRLEDYIVGRVLFEEFAKPPKKSSKKRGK